VVKYHGLARRYLTGRGFLMRPLLNGGTLGGRSVMGTSDTIQTKLIRYRGGLVSFRIPVDWQELYGLDGGGEFQPDTPDGRALRLRVTTARAPYTVTQETAGAFAAKSNPDAALQHLASGDVCARSTFQTVEEGEAVVTHVWKVYNAVPPEHIRVALFTYTYFKSVESSTALIGEVALLDREILSATFAAGLGVTPP